MNDSAVAPEGRSLTEILDACRGREVWVVGDLMLDEYVHGSVERVSPEAPVPVVRAGDLQFRLGGAANVARQVGVLGAHVTLGGVVGGDEAGRQLLVDCRAAGIDVRAVMQIDGRRTTRKLRVLGRGQQLIRLDWEDARSCENTITEQLQRALESGARPDVIILSDYAKGVLTDAAIGRLTATGRAAGTGFSLIRSAGT